jgi:hypothetical protein
MANKRMHDSTKPEEFADPRASSDQARQLQREMVALEADLQRARQLIESNSHAEHWGKALERDWSWRSAPPQAERSSDDSH